MSDQPTASIEDSDVWHDANTLPDEAFVPDLINPEPLDEAVEIGLRHHCPNCSRLDRVRDFRTDPGFLQIDVRRAEARAAELEKALRVLGCSLQAHR